MDLKELCQRYNQGERFVFNFFWGGYLSNWFESDFVVNGFKYWCNEQYMMAKKVELFGDLVSKDAVMKSNDQREIKNIGRKCTGFDQKLWDENKEIIVYDGCYAKFTQNLKLLDYIKSQKDKVLVEASPYDTIWGIGLGKEEGVYLENPNNWRGTNLLGFTLMRVRDMILSEGR